VSLPLVPSVKNWDVTQLIMVFMGIGVSTGFAEDDFLDMDPEAETFGHKAGADGEVTRWRNPNAIINKLTLKLMQTSIANSLFSAIATLDESTPGGAGIGPMLILDLQGTTLYAAQYCWVSKRPKRTFGKEVKTREWELTAVVDEAFDGNNLFLEAAKNDIATFYEGGEISPIGTFQQESEVDYLLSHAF
jgi:hypothetical protein